MSWVPKPRHVGARHSEPKVITEQQIRDIVKRIPVPGCPDPFALWVKQTCMETYLFKALRGKKVCPEGLEDMVRQMAIYNDKAYLNPGVPPASAIAGGIGGSTTHMTTKTIHKAGQDTGLSGIRQIENLFYGYDVPHLETMNIYFKDRKSVKDVVRMKSDFEAVTIGMLIDDSMSTIVSPENLDDATWLHPFQFITGTKIPSSLAVLRLYLPIQKLLLYRTTPEEVAEALQYDSKKIIFPIVVAYEALTSKLPTDEYVSMIIFPHTEDAIRNYLLGKRLEHRSTPEANLQKFFLTSYVNPDLGRIRIKGISGVSQLTPSVTPVTQIILKSDKLPTHLYEQVEWADPTPDNYTYFQPHREAISKRLIWILYLNQREIKYNGLSVQHLLELLADTGITYMTTLKEVDFGEVIDYAVVVKMPDEPAKKDKDNKPVFGVAEGELFISKKGKYKYEKPVTRIDRLVEASRDANIIRLADLIEKGVISKMVYSPSQLEMKSQVVSATTMGSNFSEVMIHPAVDQRFTWSTSPKQVEEVLGVEAVNSLIARRLQTILESAGAPLVPANAILAAAKMTHTGRYIGISHTGHTAAQTEITNAANLERTANIMTTGGAYGVKENPSSDIPSAVLFGQRAPIGTGAFEVGISKDYQPKTLLSEHDTKRLAKLSANKNKVKNPDTIRQGDGAKPIAPASGESVKFRSGEEAEGEDEKQSGLDQGTISGEMLNAGGVADFTGLRFTPQQVAQARKKLPVLRDKKSISDALAKQRQQQGTQQTSTFSANVNDILNNIVKANIQLVIPTTTSVLELQPSIVVPTNVFNYLDIRTLRFTRPADYTMPTGWLANRLKL